MRESRLMQLQYATAAAALVLVAVHLLMQGVLVPYSTAISFDRVLAVYKDGVDVSLLEILLIVVVAHGFNGVRIILLELRQTRSWTTWVSRGALIAAAGTIAYGTRTILLAVLGAPS